jgi:hypothetical protein
LFSLHIHIIIYQGAWERVSKDKIATIVEKYDHQVLMPLLVMVSKHLNLGNVENLPPLIAITNDSVWGVSTSIRKVSLSLVKLELFCMAICL